MKKFITLILMFVFLAGLNAILIVFEDHLSFIPISIVTKGVFLLMHGIALFSVYVVIKDVKIFRSDKDDETL